MLEGIIGLPGNGKSYHATSLMFWIAVFSRPVTGPFIVTSVPMKFPGFREQVVREREKRFGKAAPAFDLDDNIRVISKRDATEFYRFRSGGLILPQSPDRIAIANRNQALGRLPLEELHSELDKHFELMNADPKFTRPVIYFIDEAHSVFSAREWATAGRATTYYASQHRHLHDNVYLITQVWANVEKQLRGLCEETHVCKNYDARNVGPFKMRPCMKVRSYYGSDPDPARNSPYQVKTVFLDKAGIGDCYETSGAIRVHSTPEERKNKGWLPWWSAWVMGAVFVVFIALCVGYLPRAFFRSVTFGTQTKPKNVSIPAQVVAAPLAANSAVAPVLGPVVLPCDGVSGFSDGSCIVHVPLLGDWIPGVSLGGNVYRLANGMLARPETPKERRIRLEENEAKTEGSAGGVGAEVTPVPRHRPMLGTSGQ